MLKCAEFHPLYFNRKSTKYQLNIDPVQYAIELQHFNLTFEYDLVPYLGHVEAFFQTISPHSTKFPLIFISAQCSSSIMRPEVSNRLRPPGYHDNEQSATSVMSDPPSTASTAFGEETTYASEGERERWERKMALCGKQGLIIDCWPNETKRYITTYVSVDFTMLWPYYVYMWFFYSYFPRETHL